MSIDSFGTFPPRESQWQLPWARNWHPASPGYAGTHVWGCCHQNKPFLSPGRGWFSQEHSPILGALVRSFLSWQRWQAVSFMSFLSDGKEGLDYLLHFKLVAVLLGKKVGEVLIKLSIWSVWPCSWKEKTNVSHHNTYWHSLNTTQIYLSRYIMSVFPTTWWTMGRF